MCQCPPFTHASASLPGGGNQSAELQRLYKLNDFLFDAGIDNLNLFKVSGCYGDCPLSDVITLSNLNEALMVVLTSSALSTSVTHAHITSQCC